MVALGARTRCGGVEGDAHSGLGGGDGGGSDDGGGEDEGEAAVVEARRRAGVGGGGSRRGVVAACPWEEAKSARCVRQVCLGVRTEKSALLVVSVTSRGTIDFVERSFEPPAQAPTSWGWSAGGDNARASLSHASQKTWKTSPRASAGRSDLSLAMLIAHFCRSIMTGLPSSMPSSSGMAFTCLTSTMKAERARAPW